jgi:hypothetical protein
VFLAGIFDDEHQHIFSIWGEERFQSGSAGGFK